MKPANFQLKALAMSSSDDASYLKGVQGALQDDPFIKNMVPMKSMMNLNSRMDFFILKNFCTYLQDLHDSR